MTDLIVVGGGLAGCEAAWQAAERDIKVTLYEMRPMISTGAHVSSFLAELVCSNSFGSGLISRASGLLKREANSLGSLLIKCIEETELPAGGAVAVDREAFAQLVTHHIQNHPKISVVRQEVRDIPDQTSIIASGPLTSSALSKSLIKLLGQRHLYFYDAIAPIVTKESIDMKFAFRASRYDRGKQKEGDYINCPLSQKEYYCFIDDLIKAERIKLREFEEDLHKQKQSVSQYFFEGCLPIEIMAERGKEALAFGPMRPVGLFRHTEQRPYAVVQLRQDNLADTLYNIVGFQTNLKFSEQKRVFHKIPGLEHAEFVRYGQTHRNTFILSPAHLNSTLQYKGSDNLFFAGQITGVEGYLGNIATGLLAGINAARWLRGESLLELPRTTMLGALCNYISHANRIDFQPMKANFGLLPPLEDLSIRDKLARGMAYSERALHELESFKTKQLGFSEKKKSIYNSN
jgi:methylenetetrahydrofolate--tRNA-(uracil-5-)-methyltransferase